MSKLERCPSCHEPEVYSPATNYTHPMTIPHDCKPIVYTVGGDERITRAQMLMEVAHVVSKRSTCFRLKVGAVLSLQGRIISIGYNGSRPGHVHCTPATCNPEHRCTRTIHAERNAINFARLQGIDDFSNLELYITDSPCMDCAKYIESTGIRVVYYDREYRLMESIEWLRNKGVTIASYATILPHQR